VIVAVCSARAVQVAVYEIVDMVAMGNRSMSAVGAMFVAGVMTIALMLGCAGNRVSC